jgi:drug/metabolite transporter (DMT)-like permease
MHESSSLKAAKAGRYAFAALIVSNVFLALGPWMVRSADTGPIASGFWRLALAAPLLVLLARVGKDRVPFRLGPAMTAAIIVGGLFFAADLAAWHAGILRTKLANATLFGNVSSLLFPLYGFIVARMLPRPMQALALLAAMAGGALLLGSSYELSPEHLVGDLLAILAGIFYTFYLIAMDRARKTLAPLPVLALATIAGAVPLLLFAVAAGEQVMPTDWTPLILLSIGSQVIGQGLLIFAMGHLSPLVVGIVFLLQPVMTAVVGWIVYDERMSGIDFVGAALIAAALVLIRLPGREEQR